MHMRCTGWVWALACSLASCLDSGTTQCGDKICPPGKVCSADLGICVAPTCGDGVVAPPEQCDGAPPPGQTCLDHEYDTGLLGCHPGLCTLDFTDCRRIGWQPMTSGTTQTI